MAAQGTTTVTCDDWMAFSRMLSSCGGRDVFHSACAAVLSVPLPVLGGSRRETAAYSVSRTVRRFSSL